ncbi:hypothetical protein KBC75_04050 [Candidatus Shapirobacteria bacterium]|nr:hypothetical protein [Candidatus Shapirobacteria bacterium]
MTTKSREVVHTLVKYIEMSLAFLVILAVMFFAFNSLQIFVVADWYSKDTFYELIYRVLLITIGLEMAKMLVIHNFLSILELLAFVVARKMLKPDETMVDVVLGVVSFVAILAANKYLIGKTTTSGNKIIHRL